MRRILVISTAQPILGDRLETLISSTTPYEVLGTEYGVERGMECVRELQPEALIIDNTNLFGGDSIPLDPFIGMASKVIEVNLKDATMVVHAGDQRVEKTIHDFIDDLIDVLEPVADLNSITDEEWAAMASSRSELYGFLGAVYCRLPDDKLAESLASEELSSFLSSVSQAKDLPVDMSQGLGLIENFIRESQEKDKEQLKTALGVERTMLLRGIKPGYGPPPPYESIYSSANEKQPNMAVTVSVKKEYADAGVVLPDDVKDQPDFVGLELDFMRYLTEKEAQAWKQQNRKGAFAFMEKEQTFLIDHILKWIPRFCDIMQEKASLGFYQGIAKLTKGFVVNEASKLTQEVAWLHASLESGETRKEN